MRVLVCGGRDFRDYGRGFMELDRLHRVHGFTAVIHGAARGADNMASEWATTRFIPEEPYPADWEKHGRAAGPIRNQQMLVEGVPDLVVAFPGGRGTDNMVAQAERAGVRVLRADG